MPRPTLDTHRPRATTGRLRTRTPAQLRLYLSARPTGLRRTRTPWWLFSGSGHRTFRRLQHVSQRLSLLQWGRSDGNCESARRGSVHTFESQRKRLVRCVHVVQERHCRDVCLSVGVRSMWSSSVDPFAELQRCLWLVWEIRECCMEVSNEEERLFYP